MGIYTNLVAKLLFPLHEKLKKHSTVKICKSLEQTQWLSTDEILALQQKRLAEFMRNINQHVPYYTKVIEQAGLTVSDITTVEDLSKLPFLTKQLIKDNFEQLRSSIAGPLNSFNTGGSSGSPLIFLLGNERVSHDVAEKWRATRWWDVDIGDKEIVAWGSPIELGGQDKIKLLRDALFRSQLIPAFDMNESKLMGFIDKIRDVKPAMLFGYPSVFDLIAKNAEKHGITVSNLGIKVAFVTSERLYPYQRENIERVFGCPVANGYGGRDAGFIAHQCPSGGMHLSAEDLIVEIIDPQGNVLPAGEAGEIVVTHMATSEFPFVRYRTGDVGTLSTKSCACGRGLPMLESIEGRSTDFVIAADGTIMHGLALIYVLRELEEVSDFKIIQESLQLTRIQIVGSASYDQHVEQKVVDGIKARLGSEVTIEVTQVSEIEAEKSGKFRYVISKVETQ
jgi:phenylacetate-CoA ligase